MYLLDVFPVLYVREVEVVITAVSDGKGRDDTAVCNERVRIVVAYSCVDCEVPDLFTKNVWSSCTSIIYRS